MKFSIPFLISLIILINLTNSKGNWGLCPKNIKIHQNFQFSKYLGTWYEIMKSKSVLYLEKGTCGIDNITYIDDKTSQIHWTELVDGSYREMNQILICDSKSAQCNAKFFSIFPGADYRIIDTDYLNYAVVYSCLGIGIYHVEMLWVMGRNSVLTDDYMMKVKDVVKELDFTEEDLVMEDISDCQKYQERIKGGNDL